MDPESKIPTSSPGTVGQSSPQPRLVNGEPAPEAKVTSSSNPMSDSMFNSADITREAVRPAILFLIWREAVTVTSSRIQNNEAKFIK